MLPHTVHEHDLSLLCQKLGVDVLIIPGTGPNQLELPSPQFQIRHLLTNFHGSAGTFLIVAHGDSCHTAIWTDGRYKEEVQVSSPHIPAHISNERNWKEQVEWISQHSSDLSSSDRSSSGLSSSLSSSELSSGRIGVCELQITPAQQEHITQHLTEINENNTQNFTLTPLSYAVLSEGLKQVLPEVHAALHAEQESIPCNPTYTHLTQSIWNIGMVQESYDTLPPLTSTRTRMASFAKWLETEQAHYYVSANIHEIAWLLDVRAMYLPNLMLFPSVFVYDIKSWTIKIWIPDELHNDATIQSCRRLSQQLDITISLDSYEQFVAHPSHIYDAYDINERIVYDPTNIPTALYHADMRSITSPIALLQSLRSETEISHTVYTQKEDNIAIMEAMGEIFHRLHKGARITEYEAGEVILSHRNKRPFFLQESFTTISAVGAHAALPHYRPQKNSPTLLSLDEPYLLDNGGHYLYGTTDITRVFFFGAHSQIPPLFIQDFSYVLKAHIALARTRMPIDAQVPRYPSGAELDRITRAPLLQADRTFNHGVGHGIGYCTDVHEGIQKISPSYPHELIPSMLTSNEPAFYRPQKWGIRIENMIVPTIDTDTQEYCMETLSFFPLQRALIDDSLLTQDELQWLVLYHKRCREYMYDHLSPRAQRFFDMLVG